MRYLKIINEDSIVYPYTIEELKKDNPNTSFTNDISDELLKTYGVHLVFDVATGADYTKKYTEGFPVLENGQYYQNWIITDATQEEIEQRTKGKWIEVRAVRNQYLSMCDWTQLPDSPLSTDKKNEWISYRSQLRDITQQPDPFNIVWPDTPL